MLNRCGSATNFITSRSEPDWHDCSIPDGGRTNDARGVKFSGRDGRKSIDHKGQWWLKVGRSGLKWTLIPPGPWKALPQLKPSTPANFVTLLTKKIASPSPLAGAERVPKNLFFCLTPKISFSSSCRRRNSPA